MTNLIDLDVLDLPEGVEFIETFEFKHQILNAYPESDS